MAEVLPEPKKHLALDTDWLSAMGAVCGFFIAGSLGAAFVWMTVRGTFKVTSPSWLAPLVAATLIYAGIRTSEKLFKIAFFVFAIGPVSRIVLWLARASNETRLINEIFVRWIDTALFFAACVYVIYWFKTKVRYV